MQKKRLRAADKVEPAAPFFSLFLQFPPSHTAYHIAESFKQTVRLELCLWCFQYLIVWRLITGKA